uniref:Uncharacterized protein n=1 Tax=Lepeophtheirus salmonis TaxID=72036 RepID=A0A0K2T1N0_LEPSM
MTIASKCKKKRRVFPQKRKLRTSSEPLKLKDTVTKWSGFYSQVSELNLKGAATQNPDLEIHESEFFRRLREAQEENFSGSFQEFTKDVFTFRNHSGKKKKGMRNLTECSNSLAIFLYNRESIYQTLIQCLEKQETSDLGSLYNISVGFFADVSLTKEIEVYFDGFMKVFESSLSQRTDASVVQIIFQSLLSIVKELLKNSLLSIVKELLKNSSLTTMQLSDKLIYLFDSNKYPDYVIDFISVVFAPILRKNKFNRDEVLHSILKTECVDGIVKVLGRAIKNFGSNFFTGAEKAWSNYLESINDSVILEELHDFIINSDPSVIEFEPLVKLTITAFMSDPCKFSRSLNKLIMRKKAKFIPGGYISKILRNGLPDELFNEGYEIGSLIITSLVALPEHKIQRFDLKNFVRDILKKRPQIISHLSVDDEKFNYLLMPLFIEACGCTQMDEDIMPYVEPLGNLIAGTYSDQDSNLPQYKIVEFSTDQPNSLNTFPNRIIRLIDDLKTRESALKALLGVRPLNKKIIIKKLRLLVELDFKDDEMSYFVLHILHDLMSKSEFLKLSKDLKLVDKLLKLVQSSKAAIYPFQNLNLICTSNIENFLSAKEIFDVLVPHLSSGQPKIRHCVLNSLAALKSNEEENTIMKHALEAERIKIDLSNYKLKQNGLKLI